MSKRPPIDLMALTADQATTMPEAAQRAATPSAPRIVLPTPEPTRTANLEALAFKVSPAFRKRFRKRAVEADIKQNELLFEALDAWEKARGL
ncbi:MAG: hypothetical protein HZC37_27400 [Burkholderiales bacterium]|nr:hypothetical protein [Burkholderiales bacterium]